MNYLWAGMILLGIFYAAFHGTLPEVSKAAIDSAKEAVMLCVTMLGVMSFWVGLMRIAQKAGLIKQAEKGLRPILRLLFPSLPKDHIANQYIAANMIANIFGLGWAATPAGLKAMEALADWNEENCKRYGTTKHRAKGTASKEMCTFLILNISSLQLIPANIIAYRGQYGSTAPLAIVGPAIAATCCSTAAAVVFCLIRNRRH